MDGTEVVPEVPVNLSGSGHEDSDGEEGSQAGDEEEEEEGESVVVEEGKGEGEGEPAQQAAKKAARVQLAQHNGRSYDFSKYELPPSNYTSLVFRFYVRSKEEKEKYMCLLCCEHKTKHDSGNNHSLKSHMEKMHAVIWAAAKAGEATGAPSSAASDVRGAVGCGLPPSVCPTCGRGPQSVAFSQEFIQELNRHLAAYICRNHRPLEMVRDEGFRELMSKATGGRWPPPCTDTLRDHIDKMYENCKELVMEELKHVVPGTATFLCDGWTGLHKAHFLGSSIVFLSKKDLKPRSFVLSMCPWTSDLTAEGHKVMIDDVLERWGIQKGLITYANADNCTTMIACFRDYYPKWTKLPCSPHWLHLTVSECLLGEVNTRGEWTGKGPRKITAFIKKVQKLVLYYSNSILIKRAFAEQLEQMDYRVQAFVKNNDTRWGGMYLMLERVYELRDAITQYAEEHTDALYLDVHDIRLCRQILDTLQPFQELNKMLQGEGVTISRVYPSVLDLMRICMPKDLDDDEAWHGLDPEVQGLREALYRRLDERWLAPDSQAGKHMEQYKVAAALDPRYILDGNMWERRAGLRQLVQGAVMEHEALLKQLLPLIKPELEGKWGPAGAEGGVEGGGGGSRGQEANASDHPGRMEETEKIGGYRLAPQAEEMEAGVEGADDLFYAMAGSEVEWLFMRGNNGIGIRDDPMVWWEKQRYSHPILYLLALIVFSPPASAAAIERLFSAAGQTYTKRRSCLKGERADKVLVVKSNWDRKLYNKSDREKKEEEEKKIEKKRQLSAAAKQAHVQKKRGHGIFVGIKHAEKEAKKIKK